MTAAQREIEPGVEESVARGSKNKNSNLMFGGSLAALFEDIKRQVIQYFIIAVYVTARRWIVIILRGFIYVSKWKETKMVADALEDIAEEIRATLKQEGLY